MKKLTRKINFTTPSFIDNCFRIEKKNGEHKQTDKPGTILLKLTTEIARDALMKCYFSYIKKKKLVPDDIGLEGNDRIYINEHMNPNLQPLLKIALALRREGKLTQVASHSSYISVKMSSNGRTQWFRVYDEEKLHSLIDEGHADTEMDE